jgi:predicted RNase H-like HicB family nuclease
MITEYIKAAMHKANYEILSDDNSFYGEIPGFEGLYANSVTLENCREELESTLEDWLLISIYKNLPIPELEGIDLNVKMLV